MKLITQSAWKHSSTVTYKCLSECFKSSQTTSLFFHEWRVSYAIFDAHPLHEHLYIGLQGHRFRTPPWSVCVCVCWPGICGGQWRMGVSFLRGFFWSACFSLHRGSLSPLSSCISDFLSIRPASSVTQPHSYISTYHTRLHRRQKHTMNIALAFGWNRLEQLMLFDFLLWLLNLFWSLTCMCSCAGFRFLHNKYTLCLIIVFIAHLHRLQTAFKSVEREKDPTTRTAGAVLWERGPTSKYDERHRLKKHPDVGRTDWH